MGEPAELSDDQRHDSLMLAREVIAIVTNDEGSPTAGLVRFLKQNATSFGTNVDTALLALAQSLVELHAEWRAERRERGMLRGACLVVQDVISGCNGEHGGASAERCKAIVAHLKFALESADAR